MAFTSHRGTVTLWRMGFNRFDPAGSVDAFLLPEYFLPFFSRGLDTTVKIRFLQSYERIRKTEMQVIGFREMREGEDVKAPNENVEYDC